MAVTLLVVVASQLPKVGRELQQVAPVVPLYLAFLLIMGVVGGVLARAFRLDTGRSRALVFSGVTRNSLVVLPVALSLPEVYAITPVVVVTQTLVELVGMIVFVHTVPRLFRERIQPA